MGIHNAVYVLLAFIYAQASFAQILTRSWQDEVATAACLGLARGRGQIFAFRRDCTDTRTCDQVCRDSQTPSMYV